VEGILTIGINASNTTWPWIKVTEYGRKVLDSEQPIPHDPSGFLERLHQEIPNIDPIIVTYIQEALMTYKINCLLSSTITLGCASEKALLLLIEAYTKALQSEERRKKFINKTSGRSDYLNMTG
jgi:hypothetical protein